MSNLDKLISDLYQGNISESECEEASRTVVSFFQELSKIDSRLKQEQSIKEQSNIAVKEYDKSIGSSN